MSNQKPDIEVTVDATQAKAEFGGIGASAKTMADVVMRETAKAGRSVDGLGAAGADAGQKLDRSTRAYVNSLQRVIAAEQAGGRATVEYQRLLAQQRGVPESVYKPLIDQLEAVKKAQETAKVGLSGLRTDLSATGLTAKQTAAALRQVPAQFTDIVVSLAGGTNPLTVFLQQGGQLKDVFGSAGAAAQALGRYVLGLINPFTVLAAAVIGVAVAYNQGSKEADAYAKALILTGNAAGATVGQLAELAKTISSATDLTVGQAAAAVAAFAENGNIAVTQIERFARVAAKLQKEAGIAVSETVKNFAELGKEPLQASVRLNEATRFLTLSLYEQIKALSDQGRTAEAATVAQQAFASAMEGRTSQLQSNLGYIERGWRGVADAAKTAWDAMLNVGRKSTPADALGDLQNAIAKAEAQLASGRASAGAGRAARAIGPQERARLQLELDSLREQLSLQQRAEASARNIAQEQAKSVKLAQEKANWDKDGERFATREAQLARELNIATEQGKKLVEDRVITQEQLSKRLADIRAKYADKSLESKAAAQLELESKKIQAALHEQLRAYTVNEKGVEAVRAAGLIGESEYYQSKRSFLELTTEAQTRAIDEELALRRRTTLAGVASIENEKKIVDLLKQRNELLIQTGGSQFVLGIQQQAALDNLSRSFLQARLAAESYLATAERGYAREQLGAGRGDRARGELQGISSIEERFAQRRRELENTFTLATLAGPPTPEIAAKYANDLAVLDEFQGKEVDAFRRAYERKLEAERDWRNGVTRGLENYRDTALNVSASIEGAFVNVFQRAEDEFFDFVKKGQFGWKALSDFAVDQITRIIIKQQIANAMAWIPGTSGGGKIMELAGSFMGMLFGSSGGGGSSGTGAGGLKLPGRALGGPVGAGRMYEVAEGGRPELLTVGSSTYLMMGAQSGSVTPASGGSSMMVNVSVTPPAGSSRSSAVQWGAEAGRQIQRALARNS